MRFIRYFAALLLLAMMSSAPVMACALTDAALTPAEMTCCRMMKGQCGDMQMSHPCCQKAPHTLDAMTPQWKASELHALVLTAVVYTAVRLYPSPSQNPQRVPPAAVSPPESPPVSISILRL